MLPTSLFRSLLWTCTKISFTCVATCLLLTATGSAQDRFAESRERMVSIFIEAEGITRPSVLQAMRRVPRHEFVSGSQRLQAYRDTALPIGHQQTISPPYIVAYMTDILDPGKDDKVLEIGTGSGYQAAVLAEIAAEVYTIEIVSPLAKAAERRLKMLGYSNVHVRDGDGYKGWPEVAPFDRIIVTCSPEQIPEPLVEQLKEGGRMIIPVGERYQQSFWLLRKQNGQLERERLASTLFVPMTGESESQRRVLPDPERPVIVNGGFELDDNGDERADGWHYQRHTELTTEQPPQGERALRFRNNEAGQISQALQGMGVDGKRIASLQLAYWIRHSDILPGPTSGDQASVVVHFYDHIRREIGATMVGRWRGSAAWQQVHSTVPVPAAAREMIIRIGLNGASGVLDMDDLRLTTVAR